MTSVAFSLDRPTTATVRLLQLDGVLCATMGAAMALAAGPVCDLLGTDATGVVRAVGIALVAYAVALAVGAQSRWSVRILGAAGIANIGWTVGSLAVAAAADLSPIGRVLVAAQGLVVGLLAVAQLRASRR